MVVVVALVAKEKKEMISEELYKKVKEKIVSEEGTRNRMYKDTRGIPTIGIGHNLLDNKISNETIDVIFRDDLNEVTKQLDNEFSWWREHPEEVQIFMIDFVFNVGINTAKSFKNTMQLIQNKKYKEASESLMKSKYAQQVSNRAKRNKELLEKAEK